MEMSVQIATGLRCTLHKENGYRWLKCSQIITYFFPNLQKLEHLLGQSVNIRFIPHFIRWGSLTFLFIFCHFLLIWVVFIPHHHLSQLVPQIDSPYHICPPSDPFHTSFCLLVQDMWPFEPSYVESVFYLFTCSRELQRQRFTQTADCVPSHSVIQIQHLIDVT